MQPKKVWAVYFSGTGTTEKTVRRIASGLSAALSAPMEVFDFTLPAARQDDLSFGPEDLVVLGVGVLVVGLVGRPGPAEATGVLGLLAYLVYLAVALLLVRRTARWVR